MCNLGITNYLILLLSLPIINPNILIMKTVGILVLLLVLITTGQAQVIQLEEARVKSSPQAIALSTNEGDLRYSVLEEYQGEFIKDPIAFMKKNFDINLVLETRDAKLKEYYYVEFRTNKGFLKADFNNEGKLLGTVQRFKDIPIPLKLQQDLYRDYQGWQMTKNSYTALGKEDQIDSEFYKISLRNGNKTQRIKIIPERSLRGVATNWKNVSKNEVP